MALREIGARLVVENLGPFAAGMSRYGESIDKARVRTERFATAARSVGTAVLAMTGPIAALGALSIRAAIQFESGFTGVRKTVDATEEEFAALERQFRALALEIPVSVGELNRLGEAAGQLGIGIDDIEEFTRVMAALGVTTNLASEEAATALARLASITELPSGEFENLGSTIVDLGNNLETTEAEIVTFALRIAAIANIAGLAESEILAVGAAFSAVGVKAERGGTAVNKVLQGITQAVVENGRELDVFAETAGLTAERFADVFEEDAARAFTLFVEGLGKAGDEAFAILEELGLQDARLKQAFLSLAGAGDKLRTSIDLGTQAWSENEALAKESELRFATTESQVKLLKSELNELQIVIGDTLIPSLVGLIEKLKPAIRSIADFVKENADLTRNVIIAATAIAGLAAALIVVGLVAPGVAVVIGILAGAAAALGIATGTLFLITLAITGLIAGAILIWQNWDTIVNTVGDSILALIGPLAEALGLLTGIGGAFGNVIGGVGRFGLPSFGHGGTSQGGPAIVGEAGPELVSLPAQSTVTPISQVTNNFDVQANYTSPQSPESLRLDLEALIMMGLT